MNVDHWRVLQNFLRDDVAKRNDNSKQTIRIQSQHIIDVVGDRYSQRYGCSLNRVSSGLRTPAPSFVNTRDNKFNNEPFRNECLQRSNRNLWRTDVDNALGALARQGRKCGHESRRYTGSASAGLSPTFAYSTMASSRWSGNMRSNINTPCKWSISC